MTNDPTLNFAKLMLEGVQGMKEYVEKNVQEMTSKMTKEQAENFHKAMKDSKVQEMANEQAKKIIELNKYKPNESH